MINNKVLIREFRNLDLNVKSVEIFGNEVNYVLDNGLLGKGCFKDNVSDFFLNNLFKMKNLEKLTIVRNHWDYYYLITRPAKLKSLGLNCLTISYNFLDGIEYLELPVLSDYYVEKLNKLPKSIKHVRFTENYLRGDYDFDFEVSFVNNRM
jgi:hypothetical protein